MADNKKMVEAITSMDVDFAQWYTDVVKKAGLCDYASVKAVSYTHLVGGGHSGAGLHGKCDHWRGPSP